MHNHAMKTCIYLNDNENKKSIASYPAIFLSDLCLAALSVCSEKFCVHFTNFIALIFFIITFQKSLNLCNLKSRRLGCACTCHNQMLCTVLVFMKNLLSHYQMLKHKCQIRTAYLKDQPPCSLV